MARLDPVSRACRLGARGSASHTAPASWGLPDPGATPFGLLGSAVRPPPSPNESGMGPLHVRGLAAGRLTPRLARLPRRRCHPPRAVRDSVCAPSACRSVGLRRTPPDTRGALHSTAGAACPRRRQLRPWLAGVGQQAASPLGGPVPGHAATRRAAALVPPLAPRLPAPLGSAGDELRKHGHQRPGASRAPNRSHPANSQFRLGI